MNIEQRYSGELSIREENGKTILSGLAVPFYNGSDGSEYELAPGYYERFARGSFSSFTEVQCNLQHDRCKILGITPDSLSLKETDRGIEYDCILSDDTYSRDAKSLVASRKIRGSSIEFTPDKIEQVRDGKKNIVHVRKATLRGIAIVTTPAYSASEAYLRELQTNTEAELHRLYLARFAEIKN